MVHQQKLQLTVLGTASMLVNGLLERKISYRKWFNKIRIRTSATQALFKTYIWDVVAYATEHNWALVTTHQQQVII